MATHPRRGFHVIKEEFFKYHIEQFMEYEKYYHKHRLSKNILKMEREGFFNHIEESYIAPLAGVVLKRSSNRFVAKVILWFLYPKYHMGNDAEAAWEALDKRIFRAVQEEEEEDVEVALRLN